MSEISSGTTAGKVQRPRDRPEGERREPADEKKRQAGREGTDAPLQRTRERHSPSGPSQSRHSPRGCGFDPKPDDAGEESDRKLHQGAGCGGRPQSEVGLRGEPQDEDGKRVGGVVGPRIRAMSAVETP